jgi:DNA-binding NtrC family response regulator
MTDETELRELLKRISHRCAVYDRLLERIIDSVSIIGNGVFFRQAEDEGKFLESHRKLERDRIVLSQPIVNADRVQELMENVAKHYSVLGSEPGDLKSVVRKQKGETEMVAIRQALEATDWNRKEAARRLKISYKAILYKIRQHGLEKHRTFSS